MTENEAASTSWRSKQNWIKNVLSKSGTELMAITTTTTKNGGNATTAAQPATTNNNNKNNNNNNKNNVRNGAARKLTTKIDKSGDGNGGGGVGVDVGGADATNGKASNHKMVYYQSTPLMIKTEQPSQAQFCTPLRSAATATATSSTALPQQPLQHQQFQPSLTPLGSVSGSNSGSNGVNVAAMQQQFSQASIRAPHSNFLSSIKAEGLPPSITIYATTSPAPAPASSPASLPANAVTLAKEQMMACSTTETAVGRKPATGKPQFKCEQCGMTFGSKSAHTSHTKSHAKNGKFNEHGASTSAAAAAAAAASLAAGFGDLGETGGVPLDVTKNAGLNGAAAGGDPYQCNVCQKTFAVPARLIRHYRTHTGERPFECEFCHKQFSVKENLQVHRRIHTKERPYKCDVCGRAFEHSGKLHRHMRIHTGERPHKCSVCEKTFIQSGQLVIHMRTHTGEKPYKCPEKGCGKGFTCSKQLKVHSRTHTGEKPYHCDICFRDFGYNHVLKLHRVQHYGSKCYKCTICDETFKSKKEMEAHIKGHANELPDDEEDPAGASKAQANCSSPSSGGETTSAPDSPNSSTVRGAAAAKAKKAKTQRARKVAVASEVGSPAPSSPRSTLSPSSSLASGSRLSAGSPASSIASPLVPSSNFETDHQSRDSGVASTSTTTSTNHRQNLTIATSAYGTNGQQQQHIYLLETELPTDLSIQQQQQQQPKYYQQLTTFNSASYQQQEQQQQQHQPAASSFSYPYVGLSPMDLEQPAGTQHPIQDMPTISPALLEAASIASRRAMLDSSRNEDLLQAGRSQQQRQPSQAPAAVHRLVTLESSTRGAPHARMLLNSNDYAHFDDTREANELIEHYRRGELARHGIHKGYAPVPKFESSLLNNEIIVRQVEAAIAPLRSSTESPERSSSPESDSMMMADRDVMTLPLRKRKLYMHEGSPSNETGAVAQLPATTGNNENIEMEIENNRATNGNDSGQANEAATNADLTTKVMRMSSVIQFAKAS